MDQGENRILTRLAPHDKNRKGQKIVIAASSQFSGSKREVTFQILRFPMSEDSVAQLEDASDEDEDVVRALALVAGYYGHTCFDKQPFHNSILTGSDW
ncbi:hypothetical protein L916_14049, partial [Phytophthora nicotianae]